MTKAKVTVSLPSELVEQTRRAVGAGRASSVSAYVAAALAEKVQLDDLAAMLDEMLADSGGPLSGEETEVADRVLGH
ncbi:MAG: ribbon-helix-helix domain-containing protein [Candidatus Dormibacteria bacterium]